MTKKILTIIFFIFFIIFNFSNHQEVKVEIVLRDFEIENGVLGLKQDVYLSIVKFLDSSMLRKV
jgi:hypothetical protein